MSGRVTRDRLLRWLLGIVARQRRGLLLSFGLLLVHSACRLAQPWLVRVAIDRPLIGGRRDGFWELAAAFLGVAALELVARWWQQVLLETAGQRALLDLRLRVFAHLQRLPSAFYDRTPVGRLVGRVTTDIEALAELFSSGVVTVVGDLVFLVAVLCVLLGLSLGLTAVTMAMVPVLVVVTMLIRTRVRNAYAAMRTRLSQLNGFLHEQVSGMPVVQLFGQQQRRAAEFDAINTGVCDAQLTTMWWESVLSAVTEMLGSFTVALILWHGGGVVSAGIVAGGDAAGVLTLGTLFAFVDYMQKFFTPLNDLSMKYTVLQNALVASERIVVLCDEPQETPDPRPPATTSGEGALSLHGVTFGYTPERPVLHDVSFSIAPGENVALVGATGSGKSTILGLLTRHFDPQAGVVSLDGVDVRQLARADLRRRVGVVPQDAFLFHGTILDNVRLGEPAIDARQAAAAADRVHLDEIAARFPHGYDEPIAERGKNLSAGERQLVAFARMLVRSPDVLLLDEATSNIDSHTEELLQDATRRLMAGRTTLIVAHRLSTVRDADRILVLHEGRLVEEGRHEELLARRGRYWRLYRFQHAGGP